MAAWVVKSCRILGGMQRFGGTCCLHIHGPSVFETLGLSYEAMLQGVTTQKNYYVKSCRRDDVKVYMISCLAYSSTLNIEPTRSSETSVEF
jgi:hypothetical protein